MILVMKKKFSIGLIIFILIIQGCGYKLGGLEVVGENSNKTSILKLIAPKSFIKTLTNSGFIIDDNDYQHFVKIEGPFYKKETSSVTSDATENEFSLTVTMILTISAKNGEALLDRKIISKSRDLKFSSSSINSSASEEKIIYSDIEKYLELEVINIIRGVI